MLKDPVLDQALLRRRAPAGPDASTDSVLDLLDRLALALQECAHPAEHIRLTLEALRGGLDADLVYWDPGDEEAPLAQAGRPVASFAWCRKVRETVLAEVPGVGGQLLRSTLTSAPSLDGRAPRSAALVQVSKTRGSWIVAVSLRPERLFRPTDVKVMGLARRLLLGHRRHAQAQDRLKDNLMAAVRCLVEGIEARHPSGRGHGERVARIAARIGKEMGLPAAAVGDLYLGGLLHDVGKAGVPEAVLLGPALEREHTALGDHLLAGFAPLAHLRPCVRHHHERYDGGGYPDGLAGQDVPLLARIVAVADACADLLARQPAPTKDELERALLDGAGKQWDPKVVEKFLACRDTFFAGPGDRDERGGPPGPTAGGPRCP